MWVLSQLIAERDRLNKDLENAHSAIKALEVGYKVWAGDFGTARGRVTDLYHICATGRSRTSDRVSSKCQQYGTTRLRLRLRSGHGAGPSGLAGEGGDITPTLLLVLTTSTLSVFLLLSFFNVFSSTEWCPSDLRNPFTNLDSELPSLPFYPGRFRGLFIYVSCPCPCPFSS